MKIKKANRNDAEQITELTIRSKDYWNYGAKQIEEWREELTISPKYIDENQVYKLVNNEQLIGFYAYQPNPQKEVKLNFLFIAPEFIGQGCGKILMNDLLQRIEKSKFEKVVVDADPNVEGFYKQIGFKVVGTLQSSIKDRVLPIMEMKIKPAQNKN